MALSTLLNWQNRDSSQDLNDRIQGFVDKGIASGGDITPSGVSLNIDIDPFVLMTYDGMLLTSDAVSTQAVADGVKNFVCVRARYVPLGTSIVQFEVMDEAAYLADPDQDHLHVVCTVELSGGGFVSVPGSSVDYIEAHFIDKVSRDSWRASVDTMASLPLTKNLDGDVRLVLDTGSLYWWDGPGTTWQIFDEVPLQVHRDHEHVNGVTGDSDPLTLLPGVAGANLTANAVPPLSAYTADGRFVTAPAVATSIAAGTIGAVRGLLEMAFNSSGVVSTSYRITKDADPLDIGAAHILDVSDDHATGSTTLLFNSVGSTLQWAGGIPVPVVTGNEYTLTDDTGQQWIRVSIVGALPGVVASDNYTVNASIGTDATFLVGYWYWDGAVTLTLGRDKRTLGNLGDAQLSSTFKAEVLEPPHRDNRDFSPVSGGEVTLIAGLNFRVSGPVVCYLAGRRVIAPGSYSGITLVDNSVNVIYIDSLGALQQTTASISTLSDFVPLASVNIIGGVVSSNLDLRIPRLRVSLDDTAEAQIDVAPNSKVRVLKGGTYDNYRFERAGAVTNARLSAGYGSFSVSCFGTVVNAQDSVNNESALWTDDAVGGADPHRFAHDDIANDIYLHRYPADDQMEDHMIGSATPSIVGGFRFAQEARANTRGSVAPLTVTRVNDSLVSISVGTIVDGYGRYVEFPATTNLAVGSDGAHIVHWDPVTEAFALATMGTLLSYQDPLATCVRSGGVIDPTEIVDCQRHASAEFSRHRSTIGPLIDGPQGAQFSDLEAAFLNSSCYAATHADRMPTEFSFTGSISNLSASGKGIDFSDPRWGANGSDRIHGALVNSIGKDNSIASWSIAGPGITGLSRSTRFRSVQFFYTGAADAGNDDICIFKDAAGGLDVQYCRLGLLGELTHIAVWTSGTMNLNDSETDKPTQFLGCEADFSLTSGSSSAFRMVTPTAISGTLNIKDLGLGNSNPYSFVVDLGLDDPNTKVPTIIIENSSLGNISGSVFNHVATGPLTPPTWSEAMKTVRNTRIAPAAGSSITINPSSGGTSLQLAVDLESCVFDDETTSLQGAFRVSNCTAVNDAGIISVRGVQITNCDFFSGCDFSGIVSYASGSQMRIDTPANDIEVVYSNLGNQNRAGLFDCIVMKSDTTGGLLRTLLVRGTDSVISNCEITTANTADPIVDAYSVELSGAAAIRGSTIHGANDGFCIGQDGGTSFDLIVSDCKLFPGNDGACWYEDTASASTATKKFTGNTVTCPSSMDSAPSLFGCEGTSLGNHLARSFHFTGNTIISVEGDVDGLLEIRDVELQNVVGNIIDIDNDDGATSIWLGDSGSAILNARCVIFTNNIYRNVGTTSGNNGTFVFVDGSFIIASNNYIYGDDPVANTVGITVLGSPTAGLAITSNVISNPSGLGSVSGSVPTNRVGYGTDNNNTGSNIFI